MVAHYEMHTAAPVPSRARRPGGASFARRAAVLLAGLAAALALAGPAIGARASDPSAPGPAASSTNEADLPSPTAEPGASAPTDPLTSDSASASVSVPVSADPSSGTTPPPTTTAAPASPEPGSAAPVPSPDSAGSPAASRSGIAVSTLLAALGALLAAGAVALAIGRRAARVTHRETGPRLPHPGVSRSLVPFLVALGQALIDGGEPVSSVQQTLGKVAAVNGVPDAEVVVLATALFVTAPTLGTVQTAVAPAGIEPLRLEQMDALHRLVRSAEHGQVRPVDGLGELNRIRRMPPAFGPAVRVAGYVLLSAGLALVLRADWTGLWAAALLGAGVGLLQLATDRAPARWQPFLPPLCAFGVAGGAFLLARVDPGTGVLAPLAAPLVTFLPGALLTTAAIELATGQMISGAGRLASGSMRLFLLALGIISAAELVGAPVTAVIGVSLQPLPAWTTWFGVALFGAGIVLHHCARLASLGWLLLVLYIAYAGQVVGGFFLGGVLSAFVGAVLMTPVARLVARAPNGPPAPVSVLPAFWLLVPGALGLLGVTKYLGADPLDGLNTLMSTAVTMVAVALGVLLGSEIRWVDRTPGRPRAPLTGSPGSQPADPPNGGEQR
ncbi:threonine/serine exporter family protein [Actinoplanes sp. NPDC051513]|uniref:threonine/serine exporter family protein n=1 Tax=Actinoplanes sp. NPDC051513 TaxID=3363908 RepID=UPI0037AAE1A8